MQEQEEIKIYPKVTKMLIGSLAFVLLGSGLVYGGITSDNVVISIVGIICALFLVPDWCLPSQSFTNGPGTLPGGGSS
ncbi:MULTISPECIES: hypothetical protein [Paenibacillus]|uniref:Uncharacterized protein n=1 Tax=Paenibacillus lautus TaxID=1401 RepID=A0A1R1AW89_PAELA|nr:hypothetical protein [Paenibacillus lautus]OME89689.1 hypothetical protein BK123_25285 [Paenibacillus lautus]